MKRIAVIIVVLIVAVSSVGAFSISSSKYTESWEEANVLSDFYSVTEPSGDTVEVTTDFATDGVRGLHIQLGGGTNNPSLEPQSEHKIFSSGVDDTTVMTWDWKYDFDESPDTARRAKMVLQSDTGGGVTVEAFRSDSLGDTHIELRSGIGGSNQSTAAFDEGTTQNMRLEVDWPENESRLFVDDELVSTIDLTSFWGNDSDIFVEWELITGTTDDNSELWADNIQLVSNANQLDRSLSLDVKTFMEHATKQDYEVTLTEGDTDTDVTADANLTSSHPNILTVDNDSDQLIATGDTSVNQEVEITAKYDGESTSENVTVANKSIKNIAALPPPTWPSAVIGHPGETTGGTDSWPGAVQLQWIFVCMVVAAIVSWKAANPWMGLGTVEIMLLFGWAIDWVGDGVLIASIVFLIYAALTLTDIASGNLGPGTRT